MTLLHSFSTSHQRKQYTHDGFTVVELIVVIAIIGILAAIAIPSYFSWLPGIHLRDASRELFSDMYRAKAEAIKRNRNVVITFSTVSCVPTVPDGSGSYRIFIDDGTGGGTAGNGTQDGGEATLLQKSMPKDVALCTQTFGVSSKTGFSPNGTIPTSMNPGKATLKNTQSHSTEVSVSVAGSIALN